MDAICGVCCAGTPTTTPTATTKLLSKMEIQALDNSGAGNGGGKACKFLLVYSRHHHHKPPSFMRFGKFDKIDSVVFLACRIPIPKHPAARICARNASKIASGPSGTPRFLSEKPSGGLHWQKPYRDAFYYPLQPPFSVSIRVQAERLICGWNSRVYEKNHDFNLRTRQISQTVNGPRIIAAVEWVCFNARGNEAEGFVFQT